MPAAPQELQDLLQAGRASGRDDAWSRFVSRYSPLLLHTAHSVAREHDRAMDAFAHLPQQLRENEHQRLRQYSANGGAQFTTWLVGGHETSQRVRGMARSTQDLLSGVFGWPCHTTGFSVGL